ncbi:MAG: AMP-binding protein [Bradymonadales bacterium]|nr:AMP-binding protein [Bradymonadales bacterium]
MTETCPEFESFFGTFRAVLEYRAEHQGDKSAITHLDGREGQEQRLSFAGLHGLAMRYAFGLRSIGLRKGDRLAIMLAPGLDFFGTLCGCFLVGVVPVLVYPPLSWNKLEHYLTIQSAIVANCGARMLLTLPKAKWLLGTVIEKGPSLERVITLDELKRENGSIDLPSVGLDDLALLQYTAGTTAVPKGVKLTYRNIFATMRCLGQAGGTTWEEEVLCSWLPLYHGMGLTSSIFFCPLWGFSFVGISPLDFLRKPVRWLQMISRYKGTISVSPAFAMDLCTRRITDDDLAGVDLSSLKWLLLGAGLFQKSSVDAFVERLAPHGFDRKTIYPVYGLAESAVGGFSPIGRPGARYLRVLRSSLQFGQPVQILSDEENEGYDLVSVGKVLPCNQAYILDQDGRVLPELTVGELAIGGLSVTSGYYQAEEAFTSRLVSIEGSDKLFFRTGDTGFFEQGELFLTGRLCDLVSIEGRTYFLDHLDQVVENCPGIRRGCTASFTIKNQAGVDTLAVVAECKATSRKEKEAIAQRSKSVLEQTVGITPTAIALIPPRSIPKTSSGKIQRYRCRDLFLAGSLPNAADISLLTKAKLLIHSVNGNLRFKARSRHKAPGEKNVAD